MKPLAFRSHHRFSQGISILSGRGAAVLAAVALCLAVPVVSYLMAPRYLGGPRREWITRVEFDHEYFGAI